MTPVTPVLNEEFVPMEIVIAKDQPEYLPLPALCSERGIVLTRWKLTDEERAAIAEGADVFLSVWRFDQPLQPVRIEIGACDRDLMEIARQMELV